jgi:predicted short-subunit dehydrogenase-like oxidoreductase (DUF2520 family)
VSAARIATRRLDRVANLADHEHVGVLPQDVPDSVFVAARVAADLDLGDEGLVRWSWMNSTGILDGDDPAGVACG